MKDKIIKLDSCIDIRFELSMYKNSNNIPLFANQARKIVDRVNTQRELEKNYLIALKPCLDEAVRERIMNNTLKEILENIETLAYKGINNYLFKLELKDNIIKFSDELSKTLIVYGYNCEVILCPEDDLITVNKVELYISW